MRWHSPKSPSGLDKRNKSVRWWGCTTMFFFFNPKNLTSERPVALLPTLIRWWEALRAPGGGEVAAKVPN